MLAVLLLVLAGSQSARAQGGAAATTREIQAVNFCDLMQHPAQYDGKTVKVTATYAHGLELAILFDDACKQSKAEPDVIASAKFTRSSGSSQALKKLNKFLAKYKVREAQMTIIAAFTDNYSPKQEPAPLTGPRYTLEVKQLLAVERVKAGGAPLRLD